MIAPAVLADKVPVWTFELVACVTAPAMSAPTPRVVVPVAPVVRLPRPTVLAWRIAIAAVDALVVVSEPAPSAIAAPPPSTLIVPVPALTALLTVTPPDTLDRLIAPLLEVTALLSVSRPVPLFNAIAPAFVTSAPEVVSVVPAVATRPVFTPNVGAARVRPLAVRTATPAPRPVRVTAPLKSLVADWRLIEPAPALMVLVPPALIEPVVWLTPPPVSVTMPALVVAVMFWLLSTRAPADVMLTALAAVPTAPVKVRPMLSLSVKAPPRVTAPSDEITLA